MTETNNIQESREPNPGTFEYVAFISYRHLPIDTEAAKLVQKAIENYRLPKGVNASKGGESSSNEGTSKKESSKNRTLGKCFRDEDELAASHSLPEHIKKALAQSKSLIVICTPDTTGSIWVQREISEFISLHGRENVIPVLASGSSRESIPEILKSQETIVIGDETIEAEASPLAADLRSEDKKKQKAEQLRVIAAVAGCDYDDLKQRQQRRNRQRNTIVAFSIIGVLAIAIGIFIWVLGLSNDRNIAESKQLAAESQDHLAKGERIEAIEAALAALPSSSEDKTKPLVPEAESALRMALNKDRNLEFKWFPYMTTKTNGAIVDYVVPDNPNPSENGEFWMAVLDDSFTISGYLQYAGYKTFSINIKKYSSDPDNIDIGNWKILPMDNESFLAVEQGEKSTIFLINGKTGELLWNKSLPSVVSLCVSPSKTAISASCIIEGQGVVNFLIRAKDCELLKSSGWGFNAPAVLFWGPSCLSKDNRYAFVGIPSGVLCFDLENNKSKRLTRYEYGEKPTQVLISKNKLFILSHTLMDESIFNEEGTADGEQLSAVNLKYTIEAFSLDDLSSLWKISDTFNPVSFNYGTKELVPSGAPEISLTTSFDKTYLMLKVENELSLKSLSNGKEIYSDSLESVVLSANDENEDALRGIVLVTSGGKILFRMPFSSIEMVSKSALQTQTNYSPDTAYSYVGLMGITTIIQPYDDKSRLITYILNGSFKNAKEYTFDELIEDAHTNLKFYYGEKR